MKSAATKSSKGQGTEHVKKTPLPSLQTCIDAIKKLSTENEKSSIGDQVEVYTSSLAFLCHLKTDQATLFQANR